MYNKEIADTFHTIADLLSIQGANQFRVRAYRQGARIVEGESEQFSKKIQRGDDITEIKGIGKELSEKIHEMVETNQLQFLTDLQQEVSQDLQYMLAMEHLGPKRVQQLHQELGIETLQDLEEALEAGEVSSLDGFGEKITTSLQEQLRDFDPKQGRTLRADVTAYVEALRSFLDEHEAVSQVTVAGSYRRRLETVGDIDFLVVSDEAAVVMRDFVNHTDVERILNHGDTKSSVMLRMGIQADLRIVAAESYGAALQYFTGSKDHNIAFRSRALEYDYTVNEYGVFHRTTDEDGDATAGEKVAGETEEEMYAAIDLDWVPPELRENTGEIEAAAAGELPDLIREEDIRGDLHMHTTASDGQDEIRDMIQAAEQRGYEYIAITDHVERIGTAGGLDWEAVLEQREAAYSAAQDTELEVYFGAECYIDREGNLQLSPEQVAALDMVIISVHTHFELDPDEQTERLLKAMEQPVFTVLGHPTGRLLNEREAIIFDFDAVVSRAVELGVVLEIDSQPQRMDLDGRLARRAAELGARISVDSDAHRAQDLSVISYGIDMARRAWLEPKQVVNTVAADDFSALVSE